MTATITYFDGTDTAGAKTKLEALAPDTTGVTITWFIGATVYVAFVK